MDLFIYIILEFRLIDVAINRLVFKLMRTPLILTEVYKFLFSTLRYFPLYFFYL